MVRFATPNADLVTKELDPCAGNRAMALEETTALSAQSHLRTEEALAARHARVARVAHGEGVQVAQTAARVTAMLMRMSTGRFAIPNASLDFTLWDAASVRLIVLRE